MSKEAKVTPLSTMLNMGEEFFVGENAYMIRPLLLKETQEFADDHVNLGAQVFTMWDQERKNKTDKWLQRCFTKDGKPLTLEQAMEDDWTIVDLRHALERMIDISG